MSASPAEAPGEAAVLARARAENFPVASLLFPSKLRPHLMNVYGFARLADDIGDEAEGDRGRLLDWLEHELGAVDAGGTSTHPLLQRLGATIRRFHLPRNPFQR